VGDELVLDRKLGIVYVKVSENGRFRNGLLGKWKQKHVVAWEAVNGPIPKGHLVVFMDRNKNNFNINNLLLASRWEFFYMSSSGMLSSDPEVTKTNLLIARCHFAIVDGIKRLKGNSRLCDPDGRTPNG